MPLIVGGDLPHMRHIIIVILRWILLRVLLQDLNDLPSTILKVSRRPPVHSGVEIWATGHSSPFMANTLSRSIALRPAGVLAARTLEPFFQLSRRHVDRLVEVSDLSQLGDCDFSGATAAHSLDDILLGFDHVERASGEWFTACKWILCLDVMKDGLPQRELAFRRWVWASKVMTIVVIAGCSCLRHDFGLDVAIRRCQYPGRLNRNSRAGILISARLRCQDASSGRHPVSV